MLFRLLTSAFIFVQLGYVQGIITHTSTAPIPQAERAEDLQLFLPVVSSELPIQLQITAMGVFTADPRNIDDQDIGYVFGNLINTSQEPLYDTSLLLTEKYIYKDGVHFQVLTGTLYPAFTTTLPGQANPFSYISWGNPVVWGGIIVTDLKIDHALRQSPSDPTFVALNTSDWTVGMVTTTYGSILQTVTGTIRNDSMLPVGNLRVLIIDGDGPHSFEYVGVDQEAVLKPGESIPYQHEMFGDYSPIQIVAQGKVIPPPIP